MCSWLPELRRKTFTGRAALSLVARRLSARSELKVIIITRKTLLLTTIEATPRNSVAQF